MIDLHKTLLIKQYYSKKKHGIGMMSKGILVGGMTSALIYLYFWILGDILTNLIMFSV